MQQCLSLSCACYSCCVAGVTSQVAEVRAMGLDMIAKMVKASGPAQIQPHLADLSVTMLESLSGMEVFCALFHWLECAAGTIMTHVLALAGLC